MATQSPNFITTILLSLEELQLILSLLQAGPIPGMDGSLANNLTAEQRSYGLAVAGRALRSRSIARIRSDGEYQVRREVLEMVGVCAYPEGSQIISLIEMPSASNAMLSIHRRKKSVVVQTSPEPGLFLFEAKDSQSKAISSVLHACGLPESVVNDLPGIVTTQTSLSLARSLAASEKFDKAESLLHTTGNDKASVTALVKLLANPHRVIVWQSIRFLEADSAAIQTATVIFVDSQIWLSTEVQPTGEQQDNVYNLQPITFVQLERYLSSI